MNDRVKMLIRWTLLPTTSTQDMIVLLESIMRKPSTLTDVDGAVPLRPMSCSLTNPQFLVDVVVSLRGVCSPVQIVQ